MVDWSKYERIAKAHYRKAPKEDWEDARQEIIARLAERIARAEAEGRQLNDFLVNAIAKDTTVDFWRARLRHPTGSLNIPVKNAGGEVIGEAIDLLEANQPSTEEWGLRKELLNALPIRLIRIAGKKVAGIRLTEAEQKYWRRFDRSQFQPMLL